MVQLEEVEDQELDQAQPGPIDDTGYDSADFTDTGRCFLSNSRTLCLAFRSATTAYEKPS